MAFSLMQGQWNRHKITLHKEKRAIRHCIQQVQRELYTFRKKFFLFEGNDSHPVALKEFLLHNKVSVTQKGSLAFFFFSSFTLALFSLFTQRTFIWRKTTSVWYPLSINHTPVVVIYLTFSKPLLFTKVQSYTQTNRDGQRINSSFIV